MELGKNIDIKYKDLIKEIEINVNSINEFYCISAIYENLSLSYIPGISYSNIYLYFQLKMIVILFLMNYNLSL